MAQRNFIYISSGANVSGVEYPSNATIMHRNIHLGSVSLSAKASVSGTTGNINSANIEVETIQVSNGSSRVGPRVYNSAVSQAYASPLSGCGTNLAPSFGDGASSVKVTWPTDNEKLSPAAVYLNSGKEQTKDYTFV